MRSNFIYLLVVAIFYFTITAYAQLDSVNYQGPAQGTVSGGALVNTSNFSNPGKNDNHFIPPNTELPDIGSGFLDFGNVQLPEYHYSTDLNTEKKESGSNQQTVLLNSWDANDMTNSWPPDPDLAAGPNHIITTVNSEFTIWDKEGNLIQTIDADAWCTEVLSSPGAFDPQIIYDFYENRWFMLWDTKSSSTNSSYVISYSDDSDPIGIWYSYAINANMNGNTPTNTWADYPKVGFDDEAIYITSNQFLNSGGGFSFAKIRVISKAELYASNGGILTWQDIWNIRTPGGGALVFNIQPTVSFTSNDRGYFIWSGGNGANYYSLFKMNNPGTNPWLRGQTIPVQYYYRAPDANQLGGNTPLEAFNGSQMNTKMVVRDGLLYAVHPIRSTVNTNYSSLKYFIIDLNTVTITEQAEFGAVGYFYLCPILTVDKDHNIAITYSRSGDNEYAGGYYSTKYNGDPPGLNSSETLSEGRGNYVRTEQRNRWGDYHGIFLDPSNEYDVWMLPEYVAATNIWGTYLGQIRMVPYTGAHIFTQSSVIDFDEVEIGTGATQETITISNYGEDDLVINSISSTAGPFTLLTNLSYPVTLSTYDSLDIEIEFNPTTPAIYSELMAFDDNDPNFDGLTLNGTGFTINEAYTGVLYSSTGAIENGKVLTVDLANGAGTELGISNFEELNSLTISPVSNVMYGISTNTNTTELVRVNAMGGDAFTEYTLDIGNMSAIAFNSAGVLYASELGGDIYTIDLSTGDYSSVTSVNGISSVLAMTIDQMTDEVWVSPNVVIGTKDKVYTLDLATGDVTLVGQTGFGKVTNDMAIDEQGNLYGIVGGPGEEGELIQIDRTDGTGTLVGNIGYQNVVGLAYSINGDPNSVKGTGAGIPESYSLSQNYPNPFNPETRIKFSLPVSSKVTVRVYNLLGEVIRTLVNNEYEAGDHNILWNGRDEKGKGVSSGIYFYKIKANGTNGSEYSDIKKMILMK